LAAAALLVDLLYDPAFAETAFSDSKELPS
jgi:hypothetical protein